MLRSVFTNFFGGLLLMLASGCTLTVKSYPGPERPDSELSRIAVRSSGAAVIESVTIDSFSHGPLADIFQVLPGEHKFSLKFRFEDRSFCSSDSAICQPLMQYGTCRGSIITAPNRDYLVTIDNYYSLVIANVAAKGYYDLLERGDEPHVGSVHCRIEHTYDYL
ncbi:MAG: hypothetical protein J5J00_06125 [Deltaproteobacteria bacterium]|nr:hypothetical protein [Deltaproteobacteria bacterium]